MLVLAQHNLHLLIYLIFVLYGTKLKILIVNLPSIFVSFRFEIDR